MRTLISFRNFGSVNYVNLPDVFDWEPPVTPPPPQTGPPISPPERPRREITVPPAPDPDVEEDEKE